MTSKTIVIEWLKANKCDGLCTYGCGCSLDDLIPCENGGMECVPGYFQHHTKENPDPEVNCDGTNCHCVGAVPPAISSGVGPAKYADAVEFPPNCPACKAPLDWTNDETDIVGCRMCGGSMCWNCGSVPEGICNKCGEKMSNDSPTQPEKAPDGGVKLCGNCGKSISDPPYLRCREGYSTAVVTGIEGRGFCGEWQPTPQGGGR